MAKLKDLAYIYDGSYILYCRQVVSTAETALPRIRVEEAIAVAQMQLSRHRTLVPLMRKIRKRHLQQLRQQKKLAEDSQSVQGWMGSTVKFI